MKNRRSEITTLFMVGTLVVIGVTAVISSLGLNEKQSTNTRASMTCPDDFIKCGTSLNSDCCNPDTQKCSLGKCVAIPPPTKTPTPTVACLKRTCTTGMADDYYSKSGKYYEDAACTKSISNLTNYCKGVINPPPEDTPTPVPSNGKGCGSGAQWACEASKGYDPVSCPTKNLEFRCCVQRSNGDLVVHSCGGRYCSDINLAGITACSTQAGYGAGAPGSIITKPGQTIPSEPPTGGGGSGGAGSTDPNCKAGSGNKFACDPAAGYNKSVCEAPNLEFACCVQDSRCPDGEARYRWYGCTGQPCQNTKIANALGHLVACPYGVDKSNQESCESALPPTPIFPPSDPPDGGNTPPQTGECFAGLNQSDCNDETAVTGVKYTFNRTTKQCCPNKSPLETPPPDEPEDTPTPMPRLTNVKCEEVKCAQPKIGTYARVKPLLATRYLYFSSLDTCSAISLNGRSEESVKAEVCKDPPPVQGPLPNTIITSPIPPINFQQPFQLTLPPLTQITPGAPIVISTNTILQCYTPNLSQTEVLNFVNNVTTGRSSFSICAQNEDIVMLPSSSGTPNFQCCPKK